MVLSEGSINSIGTLLNTFAGFHNVRRRNGLYISHCFVLFACVWLEYLNREITEGAVRKLLTMFHSYKLHYLFVFLSEKEYLVLTRTEGRKHFYALTDEGRNIAALLLEGIEARQVAFFNKYLK